MNEDNYRSLIELYTGIKNIAYYKKHFKVTLVDFTAESSKKFIKKYFDAGGKHLATYDMLRVFQGASAFRASHSVSIYLAGVLLRDKKIGRLIRKQYNKVGITNFKYTWFLICLYHDFTSSDENNKEITSVENIGEILNKMDEDLFCGIYDKKSILAYYEHRIAKGKNDHGIYGGKMLYERLRENLNRAISEAKFKYKRRNKPFNEKDFTYNNLHWSTDHKRWYALAASVIIKHNIWFVNSERQGEDDISEYKDKGLQNFIITDSERMKFKDNPLLFLLCLLDTIEPIKIYTKINPDPNIDYSIPLNEISVSYSEGEKYVIRIKSTNPDLYTRMSKSAKEVMSWMYVEVTDDDNFIQISWI